MVSLIVVDYNSIFKTLKYIDHCIDNFKNESINIIIVDNSSSNESLSAIKNTSAEYCETKEFEGRDIFIYKYREYNLALIRANENLGYARGNNLGAKVSKFLYSDRYLIFSNNDLKFPTNIDIAQFINIFEKDESIGVIGPKIIGLDGKPQSPRKYNNIWKQLIAYYPNILMGNIFDKYILNVDYTNENKYTYWVMGCFTIVDSNKFFEVGMFDENTFLFAEEMILSEKLIKKNYKNYFMNEIEIVHEHGETVKSTFNLIKGMEISFKSNYYYFSKYIKSNKFSLFLAKSSFCLFKMLFPISCFLKKYIKKIIRRTL